MIVATVMGRYSLARLASQDFGISAVKPAETRIRVTAKVSCEAQDPLS